jgi:pimeloyl-ACP methyl ester carboxylesterase
LSRRDPPRYRGGEGEPLVLLHGGAGTWRLWRPVIPLLEPHHDVLAPTLLGHWGGPPLPDEGPVTIDHFVDEIEREMNAAGFETAHVAGGSLGGWLALEIAKRGRARSVVAIAPGGGWEKGSLEWRRIEAMYRFLTWGARLTARRPEWFSTRPRLRKLLYWHHFAHPERIPADDCAHMIRGAAACPVAELAEGARDYGGARDLDRIRCPVLLAFPETDRVLPRRRYGQPLINALPHAEVIDLPGVGHAPMYDDPELVARTILGFTERARRSAGPSLSTVN